MSTVLATSAPQTLASSPIAVQQTFDELGTSLRDVTFVVVDLETTGGSAAAGSSITEIGAVKIRHGEVLGEFQTLVRPSEPIPPFISVLTGITNSMVADAPRVDSALPAFLEFARGCVLVAHNAPFDIGFLRHYAGQLGLGWPRFDVLDTAKLARRVITRDDAPNCKLASLARLFNASTIPNHRALSDARATVDVLHGLMERLGNLGVHTLEELQTFSSRVSVAQRRKRHLAEQLPHSPGVYLFRDGRGRVLYVGTSKDLRARVRSYFTASETRSRMGEMVGLAESVDAITCTTPLEAEIRELRLIAEHKPRYNRRSKFPERVSWVKLTVESWPRLSLVRHVLDDDADYLGPFRSRATAEAAMAALHESFPIRQCSGRLPKKPSRSACVLAEMGRCLAPCDGTASHDDYTITVESVRRSLDASPTQVTAAIRHRMELLAAAERYEEAASHRNRMTSFIRAAARTQRLRALTSCPEIVAARRGDDARWSVHVVRHGRLAAAGVIPAGVSAREWTDMLQLSADTVIPGPGPAPAATPEESEKILRWLEQPGVRLVHVEGVWSCPVGGAESQREFLDTIDASRDSLTPFDNPRLSSTLSRPAR
ncbi:MAG: DEDD exonuclease domain-containing protein [Propionibacteriales bacterium]|nr:DEDD exonuclease domain-containing protein [Propionibacteriales bacterium]